MAKKQFFAILDTETTIADTVADFACIIVDREGVIYNQCAVIIGAEFDKGLFFDVKNPDWSKENAKLKAENYKQMLNSGARVLGSVGALNRWIDKAIGKYNPTLTAYNLPFDLGKCRNTGIDLTGFKDNFCLWQAAVGNICKTKKYREFVLENHLFNKPTVQHNMTYQTNAEAVTGFLNNNWTQEPHTALEDVIFYELPILKHILKKRDWKNKMLAYNWREFQVKENFSVQ